MEISRLRTSNHSAYRLYYHLVLSMKYRHKCLTGPMLERLEEMLRDLLFRWGGELVEFGGEADHVHLLFEVPPTVKPSDLVKNLKSVTARRMRKEFAAELAPYYWKPYFATSKTRTTLASSGSRLTNASRFASMRRMRGRFAQPNSYRALPTKTPLRRQMNCSGTPGAFSCSSGLLAVRGATVLARDVRPTGAYVQHQSVVH